MKKTGRLGIRVNPSDKARWEEAAEKSGKSLSAWVEESLNLNYHLQTIPQIQMRAEEKNVQKR